MKKLLFLLLGGLLSIPTFARDFQYGYKGQTLTYTVISEDDKTVMTKEGYYNSNTEYSAPGNNIKGDLVIPAKVTDGENVYQVIKIGYMGFDSCKGLTSVVIPNSVETIGGDAFEYCSGLTSIEIPESVTSIGGGAFYKCSGLRGELIIPNSVETIGGVAFGDCGGLTSIEIPESVTSIGGGAFLYCWDLRKAEFASIESLCKIDFGDDSANPLHIAHHLYIAGDEVTEVVIPDGIKTLNSTFAGGIGLTSIEIPNSVETIGNYAFRYCSGLTSVVIPNSVTSIGKSAFRYCRGLTSVEIPNSVETIGDYAFDECTGLTSVVIPNSVTSIGKGAFYKCSGLTSIEIPNSVQTIGDSAFYECDGLTSVYYVADKPIKGDKSIFGDTTYTKATLYTTEMGVLMAGTVDPWKNFVNIEEYDFTSGIDEIVADLDADAPYEVYNLNGVKVGNSTDNVAPGLYIVRQGRVVKKIAVN